jgi:hypothetical protein
MPGYDLGRQHVQPIDSSDPYLPLHAHNPVDWYPWGAEALAKAKTEQKPIFVSIGYSTCYWCHVAERLIYSNPDIAKLMTEWFVNIKVDREERPDIGSGDWCTYSVRSRLRKGAPSRFRRRQRTRWPAPTRSRARPPARSGRFANPATWPVEPAGGTLAMPSVIGSLAACRT